MQCKNHLIHWKHAHQSLCVIMTSQYQHCRIHHHWATRLQPTKFLPPTDTRKVFNYAKQESFNSLKVCPSESVCDSDINVSALQNTSSLDHWHACKVLWETHYSTFSTTKNPMIIHRRKFSNNAYQACPSEFCMINDIIVSALQNMSSLGSQ